LFRIVRMTLVLSFLIAGVAGGQAAPPPALLPIMPLPSQVKPGSGEFVINNGFGVTLEGFTEPRLERASERFLLQLHRQTALLFAKTSSDAAKATLVVHTDHASKEIQELGEDESYSLEVTTTGARLNAANPLGVLRGLQTFLQLVEVTPEGFAAPAVMIQDQPRFPVP